MSLKQPKTILIVDDHAMFAETLGQYLRSVFVNDEVKVVTSAERARQRLRCVRLMSCCSTSKWQTAPA